MNPKKLRKSETPFRSLHLLVLLALLILTGCTKSYHFNTPDYVPAYPKLMSPIPLKAALLIPEETRGFNYSFVYKRWALGEALESHMLSGMKAAFSEAVVSPDGSMPAGCDRIVICSLDKKTDIKIGTVGSDKIATIGLDCQVQDAAKLVLWTGSVQRSETFNAGIVGTMLRLTAAASVFVRGIDVGGAEEMYDAMITSGSNNTLILAVDEMMSKMIGEGAAKICAGCPGKPDWRKTAAKPETDLTILPD